MPRNRATADSLRALRRRRNLPGLRRLALHGTALVATGGLLSASAGTFAQPGAAWLHGVVLVFLFAPLHECIHYTAFRTRWLNAALAHGAGLALVLPPRYFRAFHLAHHRHTQDRARDPELSGGKPHTRAAYLWHVSGLPYWRERLVTTWRHASGRITEPFIPDSARAGIAREARLSLGVYAAAAVASVALESTFLLAYWLVPALLGQPVLRLFLLAEHTGCSDSAEMLHNSRTTRSNALVRLLAWNMPYHAEHHAAVAIPFHALPRAHALLGGELAFCARGYGRVHRELLARLR